MRTLKLNISSYMVKNIIKENARFCLKLKNSLKILRFGVLPGLLLIIPFSGIYVSGFRSKFRKAKSCRSVKKNTDP